MLYMYVIYWFHTNTIVVKIMSVAYDREFECELRHKLLIKYLTTVEIMNYIIMLLLLGLYSTDERYRTFIIISAFIFFITKMVFVDRKIKELERLYMVVKHVNNDKKEI